MSRLYFLEFPEFQGTPLSISEMCWTRVSRLRRESSTLSPRRELLAEGRPKGSAERKGKDRTLETEKDRK